MPISCIMYQKKLLLKFIMDAYSLKATDIAKEINVSDSLVRKHIDGLRYCSLVDIYIIRYCFGITVNDFA